MRCAAGNRPFGFTGWGSRRTACHVFRRAREAAEVLRRVSTAFWVLLENLLAEANLAPRRQVCTPPYRSSCPSPASQRRRFRGPPTKHALAPLPCLPDAAGLRPARSGRAASPPSDITLLHRLRVRVPPGALHRDCEPRGGRAEAVPHARAQSPPAPRAGSAAPR